MHWSQQVEAEIGVHLLYYKKVKRILTIKFCIDNMSLLLLSSD